MTLEEAINHCKDKGQDCSECAEEHRQLAEWLEELKRLRTGGSNMEYPIKGICEECPYGELKVATDIKGIIKPVVVTRRLVCEHRWLCEWLKDKLQKENNDSI